MTTEQIQLKHKLTDKEMAGLARQQAEHLQAKQVAESEFQSIRTVYKAKIEEAQAKVQGTSALVQSGFEMRTVQCLIINERPEGFRLSVRLDSGHVAIRRKLEDQERQLKLSEVYDPLIAVALLPVDDETWDAEFAQVPLRQDEFDALRHCPDVKMQDLKPVRAQIGAAPDDKKTEEKKKGKK